MGIDFGFDDDEHQMRFVKHTHLPGNEEYELKS